MAIVKPFKGIRPPKELVEEVESRPYDVLDSEEARAEAGDNEKSLYHIIKPEIVKHCTRTVLPLLGHSHIVPHQHLALPGSLKEIYIISQCREI